MSRRTLARGLRRCFCGRDDDPSLADEGRSAKATNAAAVTTKSNNINENRPGLPGSNAPSGGGGSGDAALAAAFGERCVLTAPARQDVLFDVPSTPDANDARDTTAIEGRQKRPTPARETDGVCAIYEQATGNKYKFDGAKDYQAWKRMRAQFSVEEIEARWRTGLLAKGYQHTANLAQLDAKWNDLGSIEVRPDALKAKPAEGEAVSILPACDACGVEGKTWLKFCRHWLCTSCVEQARAVADSVPLPSPRPLSPGDPRVREFQMAQDMAVAEWARSRKETRR